MTGEFETKDSGERESFSSGMVRDTNDGKTLWHLTADGPMLRRWAELLTRGAVKYERRNWMKANSEEELERARESAFRHFMQWYLGENPEEDHAAAVFFNINEVEFIRGRAKRPHQHGDSIWCSQDHTQGPRTMVSSDGVLHDEKAACWWKGCEPACKPVTAPVNYPPDFDTRGR